MKYFITLIAFCIVFHANALNHHRKHKPRIDSITCSNCNSNLLTDKDNKKEHVKKKDIFY
jgi:hypothetical protein